MQSKVSLLGREGGLGSLNDLQFHRGGEQMETVRKWRRI